VYSGDAWRTLYKTIIVLYSSGGDKHAYAIWNGLYFLVCFVIIIHYRQNIASA
jgi:hypothetical protein